MGFHLSERRLAARAVCSIHRVVPRAPDSPRAAPRWQRPSPARRARTPRGAAIVSAFCVRRASDSTAKPRTVGRVGSAAANCNSTARCVAPEFMPNLEPVARGRHAEHAWLAPTGCIAIGHRAPTMRACSQAALPRGQRRWPRRTATGRGRHCERARAGASACRLAAGAGRASRAERRPRRSGVQHPRSARPPPHHTRVTAVSSTRRLGSSAVTGRVTRHGQTWHYTIHET